MELPFLTAETLGIGGRIKQHVEDFEVEEIPAYEPCGSGEHLFLWIEKRDVAAGDLARHIARVLGISQSDIGTAGLKDRWAVTRQCVSVPAKCAERIEEIETENISVSRSVRHGNKLRTGQLRGNRFSILVRDVTPDAQEKSQAIAETIRQAGFPNYFGTQRFGRGGETSQLGFELLRGEKRARDIPYKKRKFLLRLALSAAQAELFNTALAERIRDGLLHRVLTGDVMQVVQSGGPFVVEEAVVEQRRFEQGETVITGPLFGPKMKQPAGRVQELEQRLLDQFSLSAEAFTEYRKLTAGTRRPYLIRPEDLQVEEEVDGIRFRFSLPAGGYATSLLREFMKLPGEGEQ